MNASWLPSVSPKGTWREEGRRRQDAPSAVPEVERQVPQEPQVRVLDVDGGAQAAGVFGDVVAEHDRAH